VLLAIALVASLADAAPRKWTSADGKFSVQAELAGVSNGKVELRKLNGDVVQVPLEKLCDADRQWVKTAFPQATTGESAGAAAATAQGAASCTLELKRIELPRAPTGSRSGMDAYGRLCTAQHFFREVVANASNSRPSREEAEFKRAVKKELARYNARQPFRGVARLNNRDYGFVFDASSAGSLGFDRLYFDLNGNGDLSDDPPIAGVLQGERGYAKAVFPRVDLPIDFDGQKVSYAFSMAVLCHVSEQFSYVTASLTPAVYREGRITVGGRKRHVVLLDSNSNGRFGDEAQAPRMSGSSSVVPGDTLLFDPEASAGPTRSGIAGTMEGKCYVSKVIALDGRFYDCQVSPSGDRLTLAPSAAPVGYVTNPNGFTAVVYSDQGMIMTIVGNKSQIPLPEGSWRLASYTMDQFAIAARASSPAKPIKTKKSAKADSPPVVLAAPAAGATVRGVLLVAEGSSESPVVQVRKDQTVPFPFGPPYKAVVMSQTDRTKTGSVRLSLLLTGCGGERCTSIMLANGSRPTPPAFTIVNARGEVVERGQFEFG
jgi:hypothetical protein